MPKRFASSESSKLGRVTERIFWFSDLINVLTVFTTSIVLCAVVFITGWGVVARFILHSSLPWSEEASTFLFIWLTFLGAAIAFKERSHPTIVVFVQRFPRNLQIGSLLCANLTVVILSLVFVYYGFVFIGLIGTETASSLPIKVAYAYLAVPVGGILFTVHAIAHGLSDITDPRVGSAATAEV